MNLHGRRVFLEDLQYTAGFHPEIFCLGGGRN